MYIQIQVNIKGSPVLSSIDFLIKDPSLFPCAGVGGLSIYMCIYNFVIVIEISK